MSIKVIIVGSRGRMGQALLRCIPLNQGLVLAGTADRGDDLAAIVGKGDVIIDFSAHAVTAPLAVLCARQHKALIIGTTGHEAAALAEIRKQATQIPIVLASNYSTGVNTLFWLTRKAAEILGPDFDLEVVEMHHRLKKDAPSGTAKSLAEILADVRHLQYEQAARHGREGIVGERTRAEIGVHSIRGGDVVGDHTVVFANVGERVELTHKASSRETFANGALRAARWATGHKPGLYDMQDVLGLK